MYRLATVALLLGVLTVALSRDEFNWRFRFDPRQQPEAQTLPLRRVRAAEITAAKTKASAGRLAEQLKSLRRILKSSVEPSGASERP